MYPLTAYCPEDSDQELGRVHAIEVLEPRHRVPEHDNIDRFALNRALVLRRCLDRVLDGIRTDLSTMKSITSFTSSMLV